MEKWVNDTMIQTLNYINSNRKIYDLFRRYNYYYKRYNAIRKLEGAYWSKYIREAYNEAKNDLNEVLEEIIYTLFKECGMITNIKVESSPILPYNALNGRVNCQTPNCETVIMDRQFAEIMISLMHKKHIRGDVNYEREL